MEDKARFVFFVMALLASSFCYPQNNKSGDIISFAKNVIGNPISSLKDSMSCADAEINGKPVPVDSCRALYYFPADTALFYLGKTKVSFIWLFIDSLRKIDGINYFRSYTTAEVAMDNRGFAKDYDALKNYFDNLFQSEGIDIKADRNEYYVKTGFKWNAYNFTITLGKTVFPKRGNRKKFAHTDVLVEKTKNQ
jgi:hypothetical protein